MEGPETSDPEFNEEENKFDIKKEWILKLNNNIYKFKIENTIKDKIILKIIPGDNISNFYYIKEYKFEEILKDLTLSVKQYSNYKILFDFIDDIIKNNNIEVIKDENKKIIELKFKKYLNDKEDYSLINLKMKKIPRDEMLRMVIDGLNELKNNKIIKAFENNNINENLIENKLLDKLNNLNEEVIEKYKEIEDLKFKIKFLKNQKINEKEQENEINNNLNK